MGQNETCTIYDDIELICRDAGKVEKFITTLEQQKINTPKGRHYQKPTNSYEYRDDAAMAKIEERMSQRPPLRM